MYYCEHHSIYNEDPIYKFMVTLANNSLGQKLLAFSRYAVDPQDAREDAAMGMMGELVNTTGMGIYDFNFHSAVLLTDRLRKMEIQILSLAMENALLKEQLTTSCPQSRRQCS